MEIRHFSHDHPLVLKQVLLEGDDDDGKFICYACQGPLSNLEPAYGCGQCKYFLHKECAVLPREITQYPKHDQHSLILLHRPPYDSGTHRCSACHLGKRKGFVYYCSLCEFGICIPCAPKVNNDVLCAASKEHIIRHDGHQHSLILQSKPTLFHCDACDVELRDIPYICPSCPFWIHESCASLPSTGKHNNHEHTLSLAYGFPTDYRKYFFECDICRKSILPAYWVYFCGPCKYFVHLRCMTQQKNEANSDDANFEDKLGAFAFDDVLYLPATDISKELIGHFLVGKNHQLNQIQQDDQINDFSHEQHPLILFHEQKDKDVEEDEEEILCNGCITPISTPYYCCVECSYFLHQACANLPGELQHPNHSHLLTLRCYQDFYNLFTCNNCQRNSNGFFFECERCNFFLDVKCAAFPSAVKHKNHKHPLFQCEGSHKTCNACGYSCRGGLTFGCLSCKFYLDYTCAMLPPAIKHRWDSHPLPLRFPPFSDLPVDFDCDLCEKEMHPKRWIYRCSECENTFHPTCVPGLGSYRNIKFGGMHKVVSHPHPLKFIRKATLKSSCDLCGKDLTRRTVFECEECNYCLCNPCARKMS